MMAYNFLKYFYFQKDKLSHGLYGHRSAIYVDIVILVDWDTQESLTSTNLHILKDTLKNRDPGTRYEKIKILNGGYQEWLKRYPAFTTNFTIVNQIDESNNKNIENEILETIEYPEWVNETEVEMTNKLNNKKSLYHRRR
ncbi:unnamed protein product [Lasius platythorax]|uniref:Rhodanese domain-containing protein n=1 Tax=Lasius platythorax TaxID=488582 RepID=A0AAV2NLY4_9HYME